MSREFFNQVDDEVRGMVRSGLPDPHSYRTGRLIKLWYGDPAVHFEAQLLGAKWADSDDPCLEVGLHLEASSARSNDEILDRLLSSSQEWSAELPKARWGRAIGPRAATWRRVSETVPVPGWDEDFANEVAGRLAAYVSALSGPLVMLPGETGVYR
ncbi:MAG: hypothetical protein WD602_07785 [Actinomycetota bacterium]